MTDDPTTPFDAIAVLGAALNPDGSPTPALIRRVEHGVARFGQGCAPRILFVGGYGPPTRPRPPRTEARVMAELARSRGVPADAVVLEEVSTRTLENAACTAQMMRRAGWSRVLVVTDAFHLPRALLCFRWAGARCCGSAVWTWRPGRFAPWLGGFVRECAATAAHGTMFATGRAQRIIAETGTPPQPERAP
jgi:uncharacterized SAM-binding protein YcdF (DUF218 family)